MLQNAPNLAELYQNNDILPRFLLHNDQIITFKGRQSVLIFVRLIVEKLVDNDFMLILISLKKTYITSKNLLIYIYRVIYSLFSYKNFIQ